MYGDNSAGGRQFMKSIERNVLYFADLVCEHDLSFVRVLHDDRVIQLLHRNCKVALACPVRMKRDVASCPRRDSGNDGIAVIRPAKKDVTVNGRFGEQQTCIDRICIIRYITGILIFDRRVIIEDLILDL